MSQVLVVSSELLDKYLICGWKLNTYSITQNNAVGKFFVDYHIEWPNDNTKPKMPEN